MNQIFEMMPLAAAIDDKFLCVNSGVGSIPSIIDIKNVERPAQVSENQIVSDLLWSEQGGNDELKYKSEKCS